jgi:hypothetical protein
MPGAKERHETPTGEPSLGDITQIPRLLRAIFRLVEAHRNEIEGQPTSFGASRSGCSLHGSVARLTCRRSRTAGESPSRQRLFPND